MFFVELEAEGDFQIGADDARCYSTESLISELESLPNVEHHAIPSLSHYAIWNSAQCVLVFPTNVLAFYVAAINYLFH